MCKAPCGMITMPARHQTLSGLDTTHGQEQHAAEKGMTAASSLSRPCLQCWKTMAHKIRQPSMQVVVYALDRANVQWLTVC